MKYWNRAWNPVAGCTACSDGCKNCFAKRLFDKKKEHEKDLTFAPHVNTKQMFKRFDNEPSVIMVASQGDLFHPDITTATIDTVIRKCAAIKGKRFLILTKRAERMYNYFSDAEVINRLKRNHKYFDLGNVAFGVSVEANKYLDRIEYLKQCNHITNRFVAFEPLLERIDFSDYRGIQFVIVGCETGDDARFCDTDWVFDIINKVKDSQSGTSIFVNNINCNGEITDDMEKFPPKIQIRMSSEFLVDNLKNGK